MSDEEKSQLKAVRLANKEGNKKMAEFKQHSTGRMNLAASIVPINNHYTITAEAQRMQGGIITAILSEPSMYDFTYDQFVEILMGIQKEWDLPVLTHNFPKDKLFNLRKKHGYNIIRDDVMRKWR